MKFLWLLCLCCCAVFGPSLALKPKPAPYIIEKAAAYFENFVTKYGKKYSAAEKLNRLRVFTENLTKINLLNKNNLNAVFGITKYADLTLEEFKAMNRFSLNSEKVSKSVKTATCNVLTDDEITATGAPDAYDWVAQGAVSSVKDQGSECGSCWAFSSTGHLEARYFIKHNKRVELSQQQLVDCDTFSEGCDGGLMSNAFRTLIDIGGSMSAADYPYVAKDETCKNDKEKAVVKVTRCTTYNLQSQDKVKQQLHEIGPISIGIRGDGFQFYESGIISDETCSVGDLNHAVLLVAYGSDEGNDYWLVKNSYGTDWGEEGYFRMQRGEDNTSCGMMNTGMATADVE